MKHREVEKYIDKRLAAIEENAEKTRRKRNGEAIHQLRVNYKKLRAVIRVIAFKSDDEKVHIPEELTDLYHKAGAVRDMQLYIEKAGAHFRRSAIPGSVYLKQADDILKRREKQLHKAVADTGHKKIKSRLKDITEEVKPGIIKAFVENNKKDIDRIMMRRLPSAEELHTVRKHIKDIMYATLILTDAENKTLDHAATILGTYNDLDRFIIFSRLAATSDIPEIEKTAMMHLRRQWIDKKAALKKKAIGRVKKLSV